MSSGGGRRRVVHLRVAPDGGLSRGAVGVGSQAVKQVDKAVVGRKVSSGQVAWDCRIVPKDNFSGGRLKLRVVCGSLGQNSPR